MQGGIWRADYRPDECGSNRPLRGQIREGEYLCSVARRSDSACAYKGGGQNRLAVPRLDSYPGLAVVQREGKTVAKMKIVKDEFVRFTMERVLCLEVFFFSKTRCCRCACRW